MTHAMAHRLLARVGIAMAETQVLSGSSQAICARYAGRVYKAAPRGQAQAEVGRLQLLRDALGPKENLVAAPTLLVEDEDWWLYALPDLGETSFDTLLEAMATSGTTEALRTRLDGIMTRVLDGLADIHHCSRSPQPKSGAAFVQELMAAIDSNLKQAGVRSRDVDALLQAMPAFSHAIYTSLLHRDLSPINIMVSDVDDAICLIDPRCAVPNLRMQYMQGCIAFDVAGLEIGVLRRQAECSRKQASGELCFLLSRLDDYRAHYIRTQACTPALYALCRVAWWSAYAACRCDFCLAPQRLWLYEQALMQMHRCAEEALSFTL